MVTSLTWTLRLTLKGYHGDTSKTFLVENFSSCPGTWCKATEEALWEGIRACRIGGFIGDIGEAIQTYVENRGYS